MANGISLMTRLLRLYKLDMYSLAAGSRSRLLETEPKLFVFETSYYAFGGRTMRSVDAVTMRSVDAV